MSLLSFASDYLIIDYNMGERRRRRKREKRPEKRGLGFRERERDTHANSHNKKRHRNRRRKEVGEENKVEVGGNNKKRGVYIS